MAWRSLTRTMASGMLALGLLAGCASHNGYQPNYLEGSVWHQARIQIPLNATLVRVRLLDLSRADAPAAVLAEQTLEKPKVFPVPFALCYDSQALKHDGNYAVEAQVYVDGELKLQSRTPVTVNPGMKNGKPAVEVVLIGQ